MVTLVIRKITSRKRATVVNKTPAAKQNRETPAAPEPVLQVAAQEALNGAESFHEEDDTKQEQFSLDQDGLYKATRLLKEGRLLYLEFGNPQEPLSLLTLFRVKYVTGANGPVYLMQPVIDGELASPERIADDESKAVNAMRRRIDLMREVNSKIVFAERVGIRLTLFGPVW